MYVAGAAFAIARSADWAVPIPTEPLDNRATPLVAPVAVAVAVLVIVIPEGVPALRVTSNVTVVDWLAESVPPTGVPVPAPAPVPS